MPPKIREDVPILNPRKDWDCPNCDAVDVTEEARPHTRMHNCAGFGGLTLPMVEKARVSEHSTPLRKKAKVTPVVREDYEAGEHGLTRDEQGRPIMSAVTEYPDGTNDVAVFAPAVLVDARR
jgi:hypothetical protein